VSIVAVVSVPCRPIFACSCRDESVSWSGRLDRSRCACTKAIQPIRSSRRGDGRHAQACLTSDAGQSVAARRRAYGGDTAGCGRSLDLAEPARSSGAVPPLLQIGFQFIQARRHFGSRAAATRRLAHNAQRQVTQTPTDRFYLVVAEPIVTRIQALRGRTIYLPGEAENVLTQVALTNQEFLRPWQGGLLSAAYGAPSPWPGCCSPSAAT
jgi:hypothetical protein